MTVRGRKKKDADRGPPHPPTEFGTVEQLKYDAYRQTKYLVIGRVIQGQPKGSTIIGFAPYSKGTVTKLGPTRFLCSSSFTMRSQTGALLKERWKCILTGTHNNWACESFQHTPPERVSPGRAGLAANVADVQ